MKGKMYERMKGKIDTWMQEGREERNDEKKKGSIPQVSEKGPNNQTSTPESTKNGAEISKNCAKIDPKGSQNEAKTDKKSEQRLQGDLGLPWGAISRLSCPGQVPSWVPKSSQIRKKSNAKIRRYFDRPWKRRKSEKGAQNHSKMEPKMVQNRAQKEAQEETGKSVKTNNTIRFQLGFS